MRLETFRIVNCFGFRDSGEIKLVDASNLVYFLGRNNSGKTAVLIALEAVSSQRPPSQYERFENFASLPWFTFWQLLLKAEARDPRAACRLW